MHASSDKRISAAQAKVIAAMYQRLRRLAQTIGGEADYLDSLPPEDRELADETTLHELFGKLLEGHDETAQKLSELGELLANRDPAPYDEE